MNDRERRAVVAERAACAGGAVAHETFREAIAVKQKTDAIDVVTEADRDSQRRTVAEIREEFADDAFVCEESVAGNDVDSRDVVPGAGAAWVVDPIDGTANYVRGLSRWVSCVAAVVDGDPVGAAIRAPVTDDTYAAGPETAARNGTTLSVSDRADIGAFVVGTTGRWPDEAADSVAAAAGAVGEVRRLGSMQGTLALVAAGGLDAAVASGRQHPWDTIAGVHLIRCAGGTVTDARGEPWRHDSEGIVASNGQAHAAIVDTVASKHGSL